MERTLKEKSLVRHRQGTCPLVIELFLGSRTEDSCPGILSQVVLPGVGLSGCSSHNVDRTSSEVAFLPSAPGSLHILNLSGETSLSSPGDLEQDEEVSKLVFFPTVGHIGFTKNTRVSLPLILKFCILFWFGASMMSWYLGTASL